MKNVKLLIAVLFLGTVSSVLTSCENEDSTADLYELNIQDQLNAIGDDEDEIAGPQGGDE